MSRSSRKSDRVAARRNASSGSRRFGRYLQHLRFQRRLTLEEAARLTRGGPGSLSAAAVLRIESGQRGPSAHELLALARAYGVSMENLADRFEASAGDPAGPTPADDWPFEWLMQAACRTGASGDVPEALRLYELAELRADDPGAPANARHRARLGIARALLGAGRLRLARDILEELIADGPSRDVHVFALYLLASVTIDLGLTFVARPVIDALGQVPKPWPADVELHFPVLEAEILAAKGDVNRACAAWRQAVERARRANAARPQSWFMNEVADTERLRGRMGVALRWAQRGLRMARDGGYSEIIFQALLIIGQIHAATDRFQRARETWHEAVRVAGELELTFRLLLVHVELWKLERALGNRAAAEASLREIERLAPYVDPLPPPVEEARREIEAELGATALGTAG
jgi:transcriptional regulator with XRE-family HTH domain